MNFRITRREAALWPLSLLFLMSAHARADDFVLTLARKYKDSNCTSGYLAANGGVIAYILERPWRDNAPLISSIPEGTYDGTLRYDHADRWRIELQNVPGRSAIQIHTGNIPDDTEGCILVGMKLSDDLCSVSDSKKAYEKLRTAFYGTSDPILTPQKNIKVIVES